MQKLDAIDHHMIGIQPGFMLPYQTFHNFEALKSVEGHYLYYIRSVDRRILRL